MKQEGSEDSKEVVHIPKYVLLTTWMDGYFARVYELHTEGDTFADAWRIVEDDLNRFGLPPRYSSVESFTRNKNKYISRLLNKTKG